MTMQQQQQQQHEHRDAHNKSKMNPQLTLLSCFFVPLAHLRIF
jgi:hypothetical protein